MKITYFVHGTTTDNEQDLATGWAQGELSEKGIKQTQELGKQLKDQHFDIVFCSDLQRAIDSAFLLFGTKYMVLQDKRLREANYGDFTETPAKAFKHNMAEYIEHPFPNGECYLDVEKRINEYLLFLKKNYAGQSIAIVAHQAPQLALDVLLKNKSWQQAIAEDWRHTKAWQPGWHYTVEPVLA